MTVQRDTSPLKCNKKLTGERLFWAYGHFIVWKKLKQKQSSEINLKILNKFRHFFTPTLKAHQEAFVIELNRFLGDKNSYTNLRKLKKLTGREMNVSSQDLKEIKNLLKSVETTEKKIRALRDSYVHTLESPEVTLSVIEVEKVFQTAIQVFNKLSIEIDDSVAGFEGLEKEISHDLDWLITYIQDHEPHRIKKINQNAQKKMTFYKIFQTDRSLFSFFRNKL